MMERPILFSGPMVRAILEGRKSVTRRAMKPQPVLNERGFWNWKAHGWQGDCGPMRSALEDCPYGAPGDRLWVREAWQADPPDDGTWAYTQWAGCATSTIDEIPRRFRAPKHCLYRASWDGFELRWRPSIHMPRWASRLLLEVTEVRVQRLQDISEEDARAEGVESRAAFCGLWDTLNGAGEWRANPWVWAMSFRRVEVARG